MILFKFLLLLSLAMPGYSKTISRVRAKAVSKKPITRASASAQTREEYILFLKGTCEVSQKDKLLRVRTKICNCFEKKMSELNEKELQHLTLDSLGKGKLSQLSEEDAIFIENYKLEVAYKCIGTEPPPGTESKYPKK